MTAEEFLLEQHINSGIENAMIGFAKAKCKELLEIVAEKAKPEYDLDDDYKVIVNKNSILNAIDLETFCS